MGKHRSPKPKTAARSRSPLPADAPITFYCNWCGKTFTPREMTARTCSRKCYHALYHRFHGVNVGVGAGAYKKTVRTERGQLVVTMRDKQGMTLEEIGSVFDITREAVRQLYNRHKLLAPP
jgi:Sigma-70, region 4